MFTLGGTELLLIGVVALLLFGPDKVPQLARTLGRAMREFNKYRDIMESAFRVEMQAVETLEAEKKASKGAEDGAADLDRLKQAADASREFAAEHGTEMPDATDAIGVTASPRAEGTATEPEMSLTATDEDEEEG